MTSGYVELHCHSAYSLLDGASSPEDLVARAGDLEMPTLALTDHDNVYGAVAFRRKAHEKGLRPIFGTELTIAGNHLTLLVHNAEGWSNLCWLITEARHHAPKGAANLPADALEGHTAGLFALSGCRQGAIACAIRAGDKSLATETAKRMTSLFGRDRFYIELQNHLLPTDNALVAQLADLATHLGLETVATNNVHYAKHQRHRLQDVLVCIRHNTSLDEASHLLRPTSEYYLKSRPEMLELFGAYPQAIRNTLHIAEQCEYDLNFGLQELPAFPTPDGSSAHEYLTLCCRAGLIKRRLDDSEQASRQLEHELEVIERAGLSNYFLIVADIIRFSNENGIRCQGRGSAASSLVSYLLYISPVNPLEHGLVFERFLSDQRRVAPDIDIDFQADRREEVIQYLYQRYGTVFAAMACTFVTFRARSALRDVGKALGLPPQVLEAVSGGIDPYDAGRIGEMSGFQAAFDKDVNSSTWTHALELCNEIDGFPRHLGIHNGGVVIMGHALTSRVPTEPATMENRVVLQWDKEALEDAGLIKIDILGLRMLSAISDTLASIQALEGLELDLTTLTFDDPAIYETISRADTIGNFQVESRAQAQMLPTLKPTNFEMITLATAIIRPGPVQGNMVHPILRRFQGIEPVTYAHPLLEPALRETKGVPAYQEQVELIAQAMADFTPGMGEQLRRALGSKRAHDEIEKFHSAFIEGACAKGVEASIAEAVFDTLRAFGSFSFAKSHAAAFAVLIYQSAWLKFYYPAHFYVGLLNNQPMGFWSPAVLVNDAKHHHLDVLPVDISLSESECAVIDPKAFRLGFNYVKGFGEVVTERLMAARRQRPFSGLADLCRRTQLPRRLIENLILAGALDCWDKRRPLIWELAKMDYREDSLGLEFPEDQIEFPPVSVADVMATEYAVMGLSLRDHPLTLYRSHLNERGILGSKALLQCASGKWIQTAGLVLVHQSPPTAKGVHFFTLEDEDGFINVVVRPDIYIRYKRVLLDYPLLIAEGRIERRGIVTNVVAHRIYALS